MKSITIKANGKELKLTGDQADELRARLNIIKSDALRMAEIAWKQRWYLKKSEPIQEPPFCYDQPVGYMYSSGY